MLQRVDRNGHYVTFQHSLIVVIAYSGDGKEEGRELNLRVVV